MKREKHPYPESVFLSIAPACAAKMSPSYLKNTEAEVEKLPPHNRDAILYYYKDCTTYEQMSKIMGVCPNSCRLRVIHGLRLLKSPDCLDRILENKVSLETELTSLGWSTRTYNALRRKYYDMTLGEFLKVSPEEVKKVRGIGTVGFEEIVAKMKELDYQWGPAAWDDFEKAMADINKIIDVAKMTLNFSSEDGMKLLDNLSELQLQANILLKEIYSKERANL